MPKTRKPTVFVETSAAIYALLGHKLQRKSVQIATDGKEVWTSPFIRREYISATVIALIELYFVIAEEDSLDEALTIFSEQAGFRPRKLQLVVRTVSKWLVGQEGAELKSRSLRRLGNLIVRHLRTFDEEFPKQIRDHLRCTLGQVDFPRSTFSEQLLLDFYERHQSIRSGPTGCTSCRFRSWHQRNLTNRNVDLFSGARQEELKSNKGYVAQAKRLGNISDSSEDEARCTHCDRLGDSIIALSLISKRYELLTVDKSFDALCGILEISVNRLPSGAQLIRQAKQEQSDSSSASAP